MHVAGVTLKPGKTRSKVSGEESAKRLKAKNYIIHK